MNSVKQTKTRKQQKPKGNRRNVEGKPLLEWFEITP